MSAVDVIENSAFQRIARICIRYRWLVLIASVAIIAAMGVMIVEKLQIDTSIESFSEKGSEAQQVLEEYRSEFGRDGMYVMVVEGDVYTKPFLEKLAKLHQEMLGLVLDLESLKTAESEIDSGSSPPTGVTTDSDAFDFEDDDDEDGFDDTASDNIAPIASFDVTNFAIGNVAKRVTSLVNARRTYIDGEGGLVVGRLVDPFPSAEADFERLRVLVGQEKGVIGRLVGSSGRHAVIAMQTHIVSEPDSAKIHEELETMALRYDSAGFQPLVGGTPGLNASLNRLLMTDLKAMLRLSILIMLAVLTYLFRHPIAILAPLYVVGFSAIVMVGTLAALGIPLTMMSNILPAFLFCVGIGHSVHLISVYRDIRAASKETNDRARTEEAIVKALASTGVPIFFTSVTTMVGLLSFWFASITAIQEMGLAGAYAVGIALVASCTILPALLSFHKRGDLGRVSGDRRDFIDVFLNVCVASSGELRDSGVGSESALARRRRRRMLAINAILIVGMAYSALQLSVWHNPLSWLPQEQSIRRAFETLDEHVGHCECSIAGTRSRGDGLGTGMRDLETLQALEKIEADIKAYRHPEAGRIIGSSVSLLDVVKESHQALTNSGPDGYRLPNDDRGVADMLFMFENAGAQEMGQLATSDLSTSQMTVQLKWLEASQFRSLTPYIDSSIQEHVPDGVTIKATGAVYTLVSTIGNLIWDLLSSFGVAFLVITALMIVLLGGFKLGLIAMVPNLMPVVVIMGIMHVSGIPIDMNNILIASISMGLAVDDTIHLLHHFRMNHRATGNVEVSIRRRWSILGERW